MAINSSIEWTESTWNPVTGCDKISPGCARCYAATFAERWRGIKDHPYEQGFDLRLWPNRLELPLEWKKPRMIFVNSMSDLFHKDVPDSFIAQVFETMTRASHHTFQLLTKRSERLMNWTLARYNKHSWPANIWVGVSVENQDYVWRIDHLRKVPAATRFLSVEPLLGPIKFTNKMLGGVHWVIVGGESGSKARRMEPEWVRDIRDSLVANKIPFFFKQWGAYNSRGEHVGKGKAGRILDRHVWNQMPVRLETNPAIEALV